jgi:hypothetical protein
VVIWSRTGARDDEKSDGEEPAVEFNTPVRMYKWKHHVSELGTKYTALR